MNKSNLKNFAIGARLALLQRVSDRAALYGVTEETAQARAIAPSAAFHKADGSVMSTAEIAQRNALMLRVYQIGFRPAMEEAAYVWFNRFIAIKYMQEHSRLPIPVRPLPDAPGAQPELLLQAQDVALPGVERERVLALLEGNQTDALYKYLLIALCNALSEPLPGMFEEISDATELLFPDGLLRADSVLAEMARLDADSWQEIQVIGWLYQYYITDVNAQVYDGNMSKSRIPKELLPAATQIFTPDWVVNYMVENSLGRLWLEGHPNAELRAQWRYFMDEAPQEPAVAQQLAALRQSASALRPEQLTVLDPCMGSGHILVYAFDVLMQIYRSVGYTDRDAVQSILENNLFGLDIDDRAAQLAYFAVMMKACDYDRRFLRRGVQPHVCAIAESQPLDAAALAAFGPERELAQRLLDTFRDAKEYGSLLRPDFTEAELRRLDDRLTAMTAAQDSLFAIADSQTAAAALRPLLTQARIFVQQYDVVITNPPYLGSSRFSSLLNEYVIENYPEGRADLSTAMYMKTMRDFSKDRGYISFITITSWMFLSSFEKYRKKVLSKQSIVNLVDFGSELFEGKVGHNLIAAWVAINTQTKYRMSAVRLVDFNFSRRDEKEKEFFNKTNRYTAQQDNFSKIPGAPVAYWVSERMLKCFDYQTIDSEFMAIVKGIFTGDNERFLRLWYEVNIDSFLKKWMPYSKGGNYRKWYGNLEYVLNWDRNGRELSQFKGSGLSASRYFGKKTIVWTKLTSYKTGFRLNDATVFFDDASPALVQKNGNEMEYYLALLNSAIAFEFLSVLSPTLNYQCGEIRKLPVIKKDTGTVKDLALSNVHVSRNDWNSFENSWDFKRHPMI